jgi:hypothetical protein
VQALTNSNLVSSASLTRQNTEAGTRWVPVFAVCPSQFPSAQEPFAAGKPEACAFTNVRTGPLTASRIVRLSVPRLPAPCHPALSFPGWYGSVRVIGVRAISSARFGKRGPDV